MPSSRTHRKSNENGEQAGEHLETYYIRPDGGRSFDLYQVLCEARDVMFYLHYDPAERASSLNKRSQTELRTDFVAMTTSSSPSSKPSSSTSLPDPASRDSTANDKNPYINAHGKHWVFEGCDQNVVKKWFMEINNSIYNRVYTSIDDFFRDCCLHIKRLQGLCEYRRELLVKSLKKSLSVVLQNINYGRMSYFDAKAIRENAIQVYVPPSRIDDEIMDIVTTAMNAKRKSTIVHSFLNVIEQGKRMGQQLLHAYKQDHEVKYIPEEPKPKVNDYSNTFANTKLDPVTKARLPRARVVSGDSPSATATDNAGRKRRETLKLNIGDYVDAKWKEDNNWYPGYIYGYGELKVMNRSKNDANPVRKMVTYNIQFDDGDIEDNVEKYRIRPREDPYAIGEATSSCVELYTCPVCHFRGGSKRENDAMRSLVKHQRLDNPSQRPPHRICDFETDFFKEQCPKCLKWFASAEHLNEHMHGPFSSPSKSIDRRKTMQKGKKTKTKVLKLRNPERIQIKLHSQNDRVNHVDIRKGEKDKTTLKLTGERVNKGMYQVNTDVINKDDGYISTGKEKDEDNQKCSDPLDVETVCLPCKDEDALRTQGHSMNSSTDIDDKQNDEDEDQHDDVCDRCGIGGMLLCCDTCTLAYHTKCVGLSKLPEGDWSCPTCVIEFSRIDPNLKVRKGQLANATLIPITEPKTYDRMTSICNAIKENQCEICGWMSSTSADLLAHKFDVYQHKTSEKNTDEFPYSCADCNLCFANEHHMNLHKVLVEKCIANEMRDKKKTTRPVTSVALPPRESGLGLTKMQRKTMDVPESSCVASNECPICHMEFNDKKHRLYHQRLHRINHVVSAKKSSLFPYKCASCGVYFQTQEDLISHNSRKDQKGVFAEPMYGKSTSPSKDRDTKAAQIAGCVVHRDVYFDHKRRCPYVDNKRCPVCHMLPKGNLCHLQRHQRNTGHLQCYEESSLFKHQCKECKMYFSSEIHLNRHIHSNVEEDESCTTFAEDDEGTDERDSKEKDEVFGRINTESISTMKKMMLRVDEIQRDVGDKKSNIQASLNNGELEHKDMDGSLSQSCMNQKRPEIKVKPAKHNPNICIPGPDVKCPICHLVFKSDDRSNCRKNDPIRTDVEKLHEHQQDKNLLHVMSDVKTNYFKWECFRCKRYVATKEQLHMHQKGGLKEGKMTSRDTVKTSSANEDVIIGDDFIKVPVEGFDNPCVQGFQCLICRKSFEGANARTALSIHMSKIGGKHVMSANRSSNFKFKCNLCGNYTSSLEHLNMHNKILSSDNMEKEEIVILDYSEGTKRKRICLSDDSEMDSKNGKGKKEVRYDIKTSESRETGLHAHVGKGKMGNEKEGKEEKEKEEYQEEGVEAEQTKARMKGEKMALEVKWEKVENAILPQRQQQYELFFGKTFIDTEDDARLQFKIVGLARQVGREELYFQYYDTEKYKKCPPRSMDNFEYTSCVEVTNPTTSWIKWTDESLEEELERYVTKRGREPKEVDDDEMKCKITRDGMS